jgi:chemotaxis methyl-accepting protein methylase
MIVSDLEWDLWRELVRERCGLGLTETLSHRFQQAVIERSNHCKAISAMDYYRRAANDSSEWDRFQEKLLVHETSFFRDRGAFEELVANEFPKIAARASRDVRLWSAGCSTGPEAYSLAMSALEAFPSQDGWNVEVTATDLGEAALEKARAGWYRPTELRGLSNGLRRKYFPEDRRDGREGYRARDELRNAVRFTKLGLAQERYDVAYHDVVFCRNVLIYLEPTERAKAASRLVSKLKPDGCLMLGPADAVGLTVPDARVSISILNSGDAVVYRRIP